MTRDEILLKFDDLVYFSGQVENYSNEDNFRDAAKTRKQGNVTRMLLIAEFDRLTAEIERLRWHYPELGELPDDGDKIECDDDNGVRLLRLEYKDNTFVRDVWLNYPHTLIKRWRYIE